MLDWHSCQICYPLEIKILLLLLSFSQRTRPLQSDGEYHFPTGRDLCSQMVSILFPEDETFAVRWWVFFSQRTRPLQSDGEYLFTRGRVHSSKMMTIHFPEDGAFAVRWWLFISHRIGPIQSDGHYPWTGPLQSDDDYQFPRGYGLCSQMVTLNFPEDETFAVIWWLSISQWTCLCKIVTLRFQGDGAFAVIVWLSIYQMTGPLHSDDDYPFPSGRGLCSRCCLSIYQRTGLL